MTNFENNLVNELVKQIRATDVDIKKNIFTLLDTAVVKATGDENAKIMSITRAFVKDTALETVSVETDFENLTVEAIKTLLVAVAETLESGRGVLVNTNNSSEYALHCTSEIHVYKPE